MSQQQAPILWLNVLIFSITGLIALFLVPYHALTQGFDSVEIIATILCLGYCGMSITVGYHRLWAHKTYQAHPIIKFVLALGGAFALQNSILHWASDHRNHHRFVDNNDKDPYSAKRGFWFSHIGWMLREYQGQSYRNYANCKDLQKDKIVMWQHKNYLWLTLSLNFGIPILLGWLNDDIYGMLLSAGVLRLVLSHHFTFFINSLAHIWGKQTFSEEHTARDNPVLAFLTYGEGYHNFHHTFEYDYRNGIRWYDFDPSKWFIKTASLCGLTWGLREAPEERIEAAKAKYKMEKIRAKLIKLPHKAEMLAKVEAEYDLLTKRMNAFYKTRKRYLDIKRKKITRTVEHSELFNQIKDLQAEMHDLKQRFLIQKKTFNNLALAYS
ncbi:acyl-CoA desaturase [Saccharobesus litoralis]|uniref:Acyl-CoA desaturase n=1 Tax=Saccharobesus litoralis TaxID=2172099 RepID=A0A2S0VSG8_9ALTE|nr:fatty acid desaturase [Saccharobesus litoralis]AWB67122.1 acyl-CoA desaturase [Saccharobesus litoralis]